MSDNPKEIHDLRITYLDAAIAEIQAVCNVVEAQEGQHPERAKIAELAGNNAQQKFEDYVRAVEARNKDAKATEPVAIADED